MQCSYGDVKKGTAAVISAIIAPPRADCQFKGATRTVQCVY